ncbi:T7SS effector LXG polymorphic toxin [Parageobacillus thermoglucosidasius]|uniref:LXG domain-containing protein n=1 Tax=Parageobacillus thermoglucosidasius TaxID=1426 RepID=A0AB38QXU2_PARTM|nr:T7SS effector LXG polymorphic toxin [Parageobacillus thermoglucosidasius]UOE74916.1 hypothetical protein IMI45_11125 [Parageobacillus thermoglucosidasius]
MRWQTCESQLCQCQSEFFQQEHLCTKPELTAKTWHGNRAEQLDSLRDSGILWQYRVIEHVQFDDTLQALRNKIIQLQNEISELQRKNAQMKNIRQSIQQFISLEGSLKGKGGEAIRNYYEDVHIPFLTYWVPFPLFE